MSRRLIAFLWLFTLPAFAGHFTANLKTYVQGGLPAAYIRLSLVGCGTGWWGSGGNIPSVAGTGVMAPDLLGGVEVWPDNNGLVDAQVQDDSVVSCAGTTGSAYYKVAIWSGSKTNPVMRRELVANYYHITSADFDLANPGAPLNPPSPGLLGPIPVDANSLRGYLISQTAPTDGQALIFNNSQQKYVPGTPSSVTNHNLLNAGSHPDTAAVSPVRGDIIAANSTPAWTRLAKGSQYQSLQMNATDPFYGPILLNQSAAVSGILPAANLPGITGDTVIPQGTTVSVTEFSWMPRVGTKSGTSWDQRLSNAIALVSSGLVDSTDTTGAQSVVAQYTLAKGIYLKLPAATITGANGLTNPMIRTNAIGADLTVIEGQGDQTVIAPPADSSSEVPLFINNSASAALSSPLNIGQYTATDCGKSERNCSLVSGGVAALGLAAGDYVLLRDHQSDYKQQTNRVQAINGDVVTLEAPLRDSFKTDFGASMQKLLTPIRVVIRNLKIDCSLNTGSSTIGLRLNYVVDSVIENVKIVGCLKTGLIADTGFNNRFINVRVEGGTSGTSGVEFIGQTASIMDHIQVDMKGATNAFGVIWNRDHGNTVSNVVVTMAGAGGRACKLYRSNNNVFSNLICTGAGFNSSGSPMNGLKIETTSSYNTFDNCQVLQNSGVGIVLGDGTLRNVFNGCIVKYNSSEAVNASLPGPAPTTSMALTFTKGGAPDAATVKWTSSPFNWVTNGGFQIGDPVCFSAGTISATNSRSCYQIISFSTVTNTNDTATLNCPAGKDDAICQHIVSESVTGVTADARQVSDGHQFNGGQYGWARGVARAQTLVRTTNVVTVTCPGACGLANGATSIYVKGVPLGAGATDFNGGPFTVTSGGVAATSFTYPQTAANDSSSGGFAGPQVNTFTITGSDVSIQGIESRDDLGFGSQGVVFGSIFTPVRTKIQDSTFAGYPSNQDISTLNSTSAIISGNHFPDGVTVGGSGSDNRYINNFGPKPSTCSAVDRGSVWWTSGAGGVTDAYEVCRKDAADAYAWTVLF